MKIFCSIKNGLILAKYNFYESPITDNNFCSLTKFDYPIVKDGPEDGVEDFTHWTDAYICFWLLDYDIYIGVSLRLTAVCSKVHITKASSSYGIPC
jgi:hypothetical protein